MLQITASNTYNKAFLQNFQICIIADDLKLCISMKITNPPLIHFHYFLLHRLPDSCLHKHNVWKVLSRAVCTTKGNACKNSREYIFGGQWHHNMVLMMYNRMVSSIVFNDFSSITKNTNVVPLKHVLFPKNLHCKLFLESTSALHNFPNIFMQGDEILCQCSLKGTNYDNDTNWLDNRICKLYNHKHSKLLKCTFMMFFFYFVL